MSSNPKHIFDIKIKRLELKDFRPFNRLVIDFDEILTVLIGENGAGKSTVMDAVAYLLNMSTEYLMKGKVPSDAFNYLPKQSDVKNGTLTSLCYVVLELTYPLYNEIGSDDGGEQSFIDYKEEVRIGFDINGLSGSFSTIYFEGLDTYRNEFGLSYREGEGYPIAAYYGNKIIDIPEVVNIHIKNHKTVRQQIFEGALNPNRFDFDSFYQWFDRLFKAQNQNHRLVSDTLLKMLNDKNTEIYSNLRMEYKDTGEAMGLDKTIAGKPQWMEVNQMSSGEKTMIALVGDLCRRLILANPYSETPFYGSGIVLIDEIDLHLHPKWQRKVLGNLREAFPNVQFVVTTHSPFVLQSVKSHQRYVLDDKETKVLNRESELSYEVIMNDYFGLNELYDSETELLLEKFEALKIQILKREILIQDQKVLTLLKEIAGKSNQVKDLVARDLRYIKSQIQ